MYELMKFNRLIRGFRYPIYGYDAYVSRKPLLDYEQLDKSSGLMRMLLDRDGSIYTRIDSDIDESVNIQYTRQLYIAFNEEDNYSSFLCKSPIQSIHIHDHGHTEPTEYSNDEFENVFQPNDISNIPLLPIVTDVKLSTNKYVDDNSFISNSVLYNLTQNVRKLDLWNVVVQNDFFNYMNLDTLHELTLYNMYTRDNRIVNLMPLSQSRIYRLKLAHVRVNLSELPDSLKVLEMEFVNGDISNLKNLKLEVLVWKFNIYYNLIPWSTVKTLAVEGGDYNTAMAMIQDKPWIEVMYAYKYEDMMRRRSV